MPATETFQNHRPYLFAIAYRMLGSVMEAEDMVQEAFLRWRQVEEEEVRSPKAYLAATVTRLCIDHLRSARVQRESYVGSWLPEPLVVMGPMDLTALDDSLSMAMLVLLESLSPVERAVFLLREVFEYEYAEVAAIVERSEAACRQMIKRARERLATRRPRFDSSPEQRAMLTAEFARTCVTGDMNGLLALLTDEAVMLSDGGGKVRAARRPIHGAERVARAMLGILDKLMPPGVVSHFATVNGQPGIVSYLNEQPYNVLAFDVANGRIRALYNVLNPDKLRGVPPLG